MLSDFWQWVHDTSPGQATLLGSVFGFLALLCGAWVNAGFNRRRDDRLRSEDRSAVTVALRAEIAGWLHTFRSIVDDMRERPDNPVGLLIPVMAPRVFPELLPKLGLLRPATISQVITAYIAGQEIAHLFLWKEGAVENSTDLKPGFVKVIWSAENRPFLIDTIQGRLLALAHAIDALDAEQPMSWWRWLRSTG
jgi:hypothetical protein